MNPLLAPFVSPPPTGLSHTRFLRLRHLTVTQPSQCPLQNADFDPRPYPSTQQCTQRPAGCNVLRLQMTLSCNRANCCARKRHLLLFVGRDHAADKLLRLQTTLVVMMQHPTPAANAAHDSGAVALLRTWRSRSLKSFGTLQTRHKQNSNYIELS